MAPFRQHLARARQSSKYNRINNMKKIAPLFVILLAVTISDCAPFHEVLKRDMEIHREAEKRRMEQQRETQKHQQEEIRESSKRLEEQNREKENQ